MDRSTEWSSQSIRHVCNRLPSVSQAAEDESKIIVRPDHLFRCSCMLIAVHGTARGRSWEQNLAGKKITVYEGRPFESHRARSIVSPVFAGFLRPLFLSSSRRLSLYRREQFGLVFSPLRQASSLLQPRVHRVKASRGRRHRVPQSSRPQSLRSFIAACRRFRGSLDADEEKKATRIRGGGCFDNCARSWQTCSEVARHVRLNYGIDLIVRSLALARDERESADRFAIFDEVDGESVEMGNRWLRKWLSLL